MRGLADVLLTEKLAAPRALSVIEGALYGPPLPGSRRAWLAWLEAPSDAGVLDAVIARAKGDGATSLTYGGPPGNYLVSGLDARDRGSLEWLTERGFREHGRHFDLVCEPGDGSDARAKFERATEAPFAWIAENFATAWAMEATRAASHDGLFLARDEGGSLVGFAAHSGNRAAEGTFGPIGVLGSARGTGVGSLLARAAFDDLADRGFRSVTVPWVEARTVAFYERLVQVRERIERVELRLDLGGAHPVRGL